MTNEEERAARELLERWRHVDDPVEEEKLNGAVHALATNLLAENLQLRVRDSNVTAHSLNVMSVNEDLQAKIKKLEALCEEWAKEDNYYDSYSSDEAANAIREILEGK
jgi:hypothetical protein